jgi:hypothetical protein
MRGDARRPYARRTFCTLSVRSAGVNEADGLFQRPAASYGAEGGWRGAGEAEPDPGPGQKREHRAGSEDHPARAPPTRVGLATVDVQLIEQVRFVHANAVEIRQVSQGTAR